jgi:choline-sulfatase
MMKSGGFTFVRLNSKTRRTARFASLGVVLLALSAAVNARAGNSPPSVILISVDTLRADRLSCYGYRGQATPHIDAIAKGGTLFSAINSQVPLTLPSHTCLFTSTYPFANGVEENGEEVPPHTVTLAGVLKSQGYSTAAFIGGFVLDRRFGLNQGFDYYDSPFNSGLLGTVRVDREAGVDPDSVKRPGESVVNSAIKWIQKDGNRPFFIFLHLYDLHFPYNLSPADRARFGNGYEAELQYVDENIGRFWRFLSRQGLLKNTLVVFTADHGEGLDEHGEISHGFFIYQSTLWVPLIFHWPDGAGSSFPARVTAPAGLIDVAPTIVRYLGMSPPSQFEGQSLLSLLSKNSSGPEREVYSESLYAHYHFGCSGLRSLRNGRYKFIEAPKPEFYDLEQDPGEKHNLYSEKRSLAFSYHERLFRLVLQFEPQHAPPTRVMSPEEVQLLSSLGYTALSSPAEDIASSGIDPKDRITAFDEYERAVSLGTRGDLTESSRILERLLAVDPELIDVRITLGFYQDKLGEHNKARENLRVVLHQDPLNVLAHFDLGMSYYSAHKIDDAQKEFQATLAIAPYYTRADEMLGEIDLNKKDFPEAQRHFEHLLTYAPNDYLANYNLGALAMQHGGSKEALEHFQTALKDEPRSAEAHNALGTVYLLRGDLDAAQREITEAVQESPKLAQAHYYLGLVFAKQGQKSKAAAQFRIVLRINPRMTPARDALASLGYRP